MGFFRGVGRLVKPLVNFPKWMSADQISSDAKYISGIGKQLITPQKAQVKETFEEALIRLNLTENEIKARRKEFTHLSITFFCLFLLLLGYVIYLISDSTGQVSWRAIALSVIVSMIALAQFMRFHYWLYQIKQRKLGCGFKEYFLSGILGMKS